ncbi:MAG: right-handed parallel beta-helix repeat-containing protein [Chitinophagales bacterium]
MQNKILLPKLILRCLAFLVFIGYCGSLSAAVINVPGDQATIQAAVTAASSGDEIVIAAGTYIESVIIPAGKNNLIIRGATGTAADVTIDGNNTLTDAGIQISNGVTGTTIRDLSIENFVGYAASEAAIYGIGGNNSTTIDNVEINNITCNAGTNGGGIYFNGPVNALTFNNISVTDINTAAGGFPRGIVVWNGLKENITITNCTVSDNEGCCGIELQDGTATGVTITGNNVSDVVDSGMGLTGIQGPGVNVISGNTITDCGRFGMEIKNPDGSGETSGAGSIVVENNNVTFTATVGMNIRDHAGIAVFRRGVLAGNVDVPTGVVVQNNTVSGYEQQNAGATTSEGFGIVIEGTNHTVTGNTVSNNDIGIQEQGGGHPTPNYPGDGGQNDGQSDDYFGRGNAQIACGNTVSGNTFNTNGTDFRQVGAGLSTTSGVVQNTDTGATFCTIQSAIDATATDAGDVIEVSEGTYDEQVLVNKEVTINGIGASQPIINFTGTVSGKATLFDVSADNVTINNLQFEVDFVKLSSAIIVSGAAIDNIDVTNNTINPYGSSGAGSFGSYGNRNAVSINYGGSTNYRVATGGIDNVVFNNNTVTGLPSSDGNSGGVDRFFRSGLSLDEGGGTFNGNTGQTINHDILIRFGSNGNITIQNNNFNGGGLQLSDHNAGAGTIDISNNVFDGTFGNTYTSSLRLQNNQQNKATNIAGNTFTGHRWAISLENYPTATIDNNVFTPLAGLTDFRHITVNTKSISSNSNTIVQTTIDANIINNTFNGNAATGGIGIGFYDHDSDNAAFGTFTIGTAGNENTFNINLETFILLDNTTGSTDGADAFFGYGSGGGWTTTMACWTTDINVEENNFNTQNLSTLEGALFHQPDDACTGLLTFANATIVQEVPTLSEWGLIILALSLMTLGVLYITEEKNKLQWNS